MQTYQDYFGWWYLIFHQAQTQAKKTWNRFKAVIVGFKQGTKMDGYTYEVSDFNHQETDFIRGEIYKRNIGPPNSRRTTLSTSPFGSFWKVFWLGDHIPGPRERQRLCPALSAAVCSLHCGICIGNVGLGCFGVEENTQVKQLKVLQVVSVSHSFCWEQLIGLQFQRCLFSQLCKLKRAQVTTRQSLTRQKLEA